MIKMSEHDLKDYKMDKIESDEINELTHKIIGCAMQVHRILGNGFQEVIYQRSLAIEMRYAGQYFEVKIDYVDITADEFSAKMKGYEENLSKLFAESRTLETEIQNNLKSIVVSASLNHRE